jgi:hypothetical protein
LAGVNVRKDLAKWHRLQDRRHRSIAQKAQDAIDAILDRIEKGTAEGRRYSSYHNAKDRAAWKVVKEHCPGWEDKQCRSLIKQWLGVEQGLLYEASYDDPVSRHDEKGLYVNEQRRPTRTTAQEDDDDYLFLAQ